MDPRERNPQVPMDPRGVDRHSTWVQQQGEDWNHHPICIQGKKSVLNPVWKLLKLLSITLSSKNIILSNIETNSKNHHHHQSMARSTGDATSERPKHVKRKPKEASSSGRELEAGTYEQLLTYLLGLGSRQERHKRKNNVVHHVTWLHMYTTTGLWIQSDHVSKVPSISA